MRGRYRIALYAGTVVTVVGLLTLHATTIASPSYSWHSATRFTWLIAYAFALCAFAFAGGLPDLARTPSRAFGPAVISTLGAAATIGMLQLLTGRSDLPLFVVGGAVLVLIPWYVLCAWLADRGRSHGRRRDRVLLVGSYARAEQLAAELDQSHERSATLVGSFTVDQARILQAGIHPLVEEAEALEATVVVLDRDAQDDETVIAQAAELHEGGARIRTLSFFYEEWLAKVPIEDLQRDALMFDIGEVHRARYARAKRLIDLPVALIGLIALLAVIPLVAIGNLLANRGPLFYRQERVGMGGRRFQMLKFRTMYPTAKGSSQHWTTQDDPRVTRFGRILRRTHIDELPQFINVLRGDLAIVGPRPEQPQYVEELSAKLPYYDLRHLVHPGMTGWAQVRYGYASNELDAVEKLQYEFFYLRKQGLLFDARIVGRTIRSFFGTEGGGQ